MKSTLFICTFLCFFALNNLYAQNSTVAANPDDRQEFSNLLEMEMNGGKPFMDVLKEKQITPNISERNLEPHHLTSLFWAANGTPRRGEMHKRTAFAPMDNQFIKIYVLSKNGVFLYDAEPHKLNIVEKSDYRAKITNDQTLQRAPIIILYVMSSEIPSNVKEENKINYAYLQAGSICQNILLYCSSEDLATNVSFEIKKDEFAKNLNIKSTNILFIQAVGYRE